MLNQALGGSSAAENGIEEQVQKKAQEIKLQRFAVLAESSNSINMSQMMASSNQETTTAQVNQFNKIQENYMKSLEYNYQRMYILRDAKIFQVKLAIKKI
jgi:hypothetical protein